MIGFSHRNVEPLEFLDTVMPILARGVVDKDVRRLLLPYLPCCRYLG